MELHEQNNKLFYCVFIKLYYNLHTNNLFDVLIVWLGYNCKIENHLKSEIILELNFVREWNVANNNVKVL